MGKDNGSDYCSKCPDSFACIMSVDSVADTNDKIKGVIAR